MVLTSLFPHGCLWGYMPAGPALTLSFSQPALPPLLCLSHRYDAAKCDVWSCGVLLYLLIIGVYPFEVRVCPCGLVGQGRR
jgi:hypothetical protein